ncbi:MAG: NifU family protein [Clostridia bacterium]|nr:NifU family protein [Clostridia bacterium]
MKERLEKVLKEKVDPVLESHFGGIMLTGYEDGIAYVKLTGSCSTCPSAQYTIEDVVKQIVMEEIPEVQDVILDTSVSEDLMDMARKLLNKERKGND